VKLANPAQPSRVGSSSRHVRSATTALKMIGKRPKMRKRMKNGATRT
jgi:hypothetical protein